MRMTLPGEKIEPTLLLGGTWRPITNAVLFANAPAERVADEFLNGVRGRHVSRSLGSPLAVQKVPHGRLDERLQSLLPLDVIEDRRLLGLDTANPQWSAVFGSRWRSLAGQSPLGWLAAGGIECVLIEEEAHRPSASPPNQSFGIRKMETFEIVPGADHHAHPHVVSESEALRKAPAVSAGAFLIHPFR